MLTETRPRFPFVAADGSHHRRNQRNRWCRIYPLKPPLHVSVEPSPPPSPLRASLSVASFSPPSKSRKYQNYLEIGTETMWGIA
jgi:hypothetical protein